MIFRFESLIFALHFGQKLKITVYKLLVFLFVIAFVSASQVSAYVHPSAYSDTKKENQKEKSEQSVIKAVSIEATPVFFSASLQKFDYIIFSFEHITKTVVVPQEPITFFTILFKRILFTRLAPTKAP